MAPEAALEEPPMPSRQAARAAPAAAAWAPSEPLMASPSRGENLLRGAAHVTPPHNQEMNLLPWPESGSDAATRAIFKSIEPVAGHLGVGDRVNAHALKEHLKAEAAALLALTATYRAGQKEPMSREEIGRRMLAPGEIYLSILPYNEVEIHDDDGEKGFHLFHKAPPPRKRLDEGDVVLTTKRMIFISSRQGKLEEAHQKHMYCGPRSMAAFLASCCCACTILCNPLDEWEIKKKHIRDHDCDGVFIDHPPPLPPCNFCNGLLCKCSCCYPCMPCFCVKDLELNSRLTEEMAIAQVPLSSVRSMEADTVTCVKATADIKSQDGVLTDCLPCCFARSWAAYPASKFEDDSDRFITIGALMPPWNKKSRISISVKGTTPIATLLDFINVLQNGAKALVEGPPPEVKKPEGAPAAAATH